MYLPNPSTISKLQNDVNFFFISALMYVFTQPLYCKQGATLCQFI